MNATKTVGPTSAHLFKFLGNFKFWKFPSDASDWFVDRIFIDDDGDLLIFTNLCNRPE